MNQILKIAHRGAKGHEPENTLIAFQKAIDMQADGIELDVHLSADREIIVIHDETIDRTSNGKGEVNKLSLLELKKFRINEMHQIPTLNEVFDLVNQDCFINIEIKNSEATEKVIALIEKYVLKKNWNYDRFLVSSFDWNVLQNIRFINSKIPIGVLTETNLDLAFSFAKFLKAESIHPYFHLLTKENTAQLKNKGLLVYPWTVNELEDIEKIKSFSVNGIITDFPNRI